jgi:hypothetical protein
MTYDPTKKRHNVDYQGNKRGVKPEIADHLEPFKWKKGQSGNPSGRTKGTPSLVDELKKWLRRHPEDAEKIIAALIKEGTKGNITATREMLDRVDGKVVETHKLETDLPVQVIFVPAKEELKGGETATNSPQKE